MKTLSQCFHTFQLLVVAAEPLNVTNLESIFEKSLRWNAANARPRTVSARHVQCFTFGRHRPRLSRQGSKLCGRSGWSCAGWPPPPPGEEGTFLIRFWNEWEGQQGRNFNYCRGRGPERRGHRDAVTVRLSEAAACSREPEDSVSWPAGTSGREAAGCYWEETNQCRATAAPSPSLHCTCDTENEGGVAVCEAGSQAQERQRKSGKFSE